MKRILQRAALGAVACGLLLSGAAVGATAQEELPYRFEEERCDTFQAARPETLTDAWHLQRLRMNDVWPLATGAGVKVAVIDTGISTLGSAYFERGRVQALDFIGRSEDEINKQVKVDCLHGTFVASIIGGGQRDGAPVHQATNFTGIAPDVEILSYRALSQSAVQVDEGQQAPPPDSLEPVVHAVDRAIADGAQIINLSLTVQRSVPFFDELEAAIERALAANVIVVAAAGNSGQNIGALFPASFPGVIAVGMSEPGDSAHPMSYAWSPVTVGAPGTDIIALAPSPPDQGGATSANQAFHTDTGTSFAAPVVSGLIALMIDYDAQLGRDPLTPATAADRLAGTADPPPATAPDRQLGYGIVNPLRALTDTRPGAETEESAAFTPTPPPLFEPEESDATLPALGLGVAVGAVLLVGVGVVTAIAVPAAMRRDSPGV